MNGLPHLIMIYQPCGKRSHERPFKDFSAVSGTGTSHEGYDPARYMIMMPIKLREYVINVVHLL